MTQIQIYTKISLTEHFNWLVFLILPTYFNALERTIVSINDYPSVNEIHGYMRRRRLMESDDDVESSRT